MIDSRFDGPTQVHAGGAQPGTCACGHPEDEHDRVAQRFCAATRSNELLRSCVCVPAVSAALDRLNGRGMLH
jgi:hypothetical protein